MKIQKYANAFFKMALISGRLGLYLNTKENIFFVLSSPVLSNSSLGIFLALSNCDQPIAFCTLVMLN